MAQNLIDINKVKSIEDYAFLQGITIQAVYKRIRENNFENGTKVLKIGKVKLIYMG